MFHRYYSLVSGSYKVGAGQQGGGFAPHKVQGLCSQRRSLSTQAGLPRIPPWNSLHTLGSSLLLSPSVLCGRARENWDSFLFLSVSGRQLSSDRTRLAQHKGKEISVYNSPREIFKRSLDFS